MNFAVKLSLSWELSNHSNIFSLRSALWCQYIALMACISPSAILKTHKQNILTKYSAQQSIKPLNDRP